MTRHPRPAPGVVGMRTRGGRPRAGMANAAPPVRAAAPTAASLVLPRTDLTD
ncbi:hypothetical protein ACFVX6_19315 [Streptomyces sp. NPDC058289]|uniref:hypothetical protein n=1 Tax=Streptomyces sp. NPDC058289 TaxID=3346425 RepID=UPI0036E17DF8